MCIIIIDNTSLQLCCNDNDFTFFETKTLKPLIYMVFMDMAQDF